MAEPAKANLWGCLMLIVIGVGIILYFLVSPTKPDLYSSITAAPCAVDRTAAGNMAKAIRDKNISALEGLADRGKIFVLPAGTRFAASTDEPGGLLWGFVRSGRNTGQDCYVVASMVRR